MNEFYENVIEIENGESIENIVKPKQKNIANCTTIEFLKQANKIRHAVEDFLDVTGIMKIRENAPTYEPTDTKEIKEEKLKKQRRENFSKILDECLENHTEETVKIIGLACFKTQEEAEQMPVNELFSVVFEMLGSERVVDFFMKYLLSALTNTESI